MMVCFALLCFTKSKWIHWSCKMTKCEKEMHCPPVRRLKVGFALKHFCNFFVCLHQFEDTKKKKKEKFFGFSFFFRFLNIVAGDFWHLTKQKHFLLYLGPIKLWLSFLRMKRVKQTSLNTRHASLTTLMLTAPPGLVAHRHTLTVSYHLPIIPPKFP